MKKIIFLTLAAVLALVAPGRAAAALSTTLTWDEPGAVTIRVGGTTADPETLAPGATQHTVSVNETFGYAYVFPTDGT